MGAFCKTFDLHLAIFGFEKLFMVFLRVAVSNRFYFIVLGDCHMVFVSVYFFCLLSFVLFCLLQLHWAFEPVRKILVLIALQSSEGSDEMSLGICTVLR